MEKIKIVAVVGPTASGKTALGVHLAEKFNGEVISADSMQIYKGMDIATAKPTADEMHGVPHHLVDFLPATSRYSVAQFCSDANKAADDIVLRGKLPILVGGTGLYADSFINNTRFLDNASIDAVKLNLNNELKEKGIDALYNELKTVDPDAAKAIHPNNTLRVLRALQVYRCTGKTITEQALASHSEPSRFDALYICIDFSDRQVLYDRINKRVDIMMANGLLDEAKSFYSNDYSQTAVNAIGYKELKPFIDGAAPLNECVESLKRETRKYAKRQLTWFKRNKNAFRLYADSYTDTAEMYSDADSAVKSFLEGD